MSVGASQPSPRLYFLRAFVVTYLSRRNPGLIEYDVNMAKVRIFLVRGENLRIVCQKWLLAGYTFSLWRIVYNFRLMFYALSLFRHLGWPGSPHIVFAGR